LGLNGIQPYLTDDESDDRINEDGSIIVLPYPFVFLLTIFFIDNKVKPALLETFGFGSIHKMDNSHQPHEAYEENGHLSPPEQQRIEPKKSQQEKYFLETVQFDFIGKNKVAH